MQVQQSTSNIRRVRLGTIELRNSGKNELTLITSVNEIIKLAITASEAISLISVNANLVAGRAGKGAAGFGVVAGELRRYSERMSGNMQRWSTLIYALVEATANSRNQIRRLIKLEATGRLSPETNLAINDARVRCRRELDDRNERNSVMVRELQSLIRRAQKMRVTGEVIARSSMIESAYGGGMQSVLKQIADAINENVRDLNAYTREVGELIHEVNK
jgi:methyl-accepting chemotaxis protein